MIKRRKPPNLYYQQYKNLKYNSEFSVAVRGINTDNPRIESEVVWKDLTIPTCMELQKNESVCGPNPIQNMTAKFTYLHDDRFDVDVTWNTKDYQPEFFTLELKSGKSTNGNGTGRIYHYTIEKVSDIVDEKNVIVRREKGEGGEVDNDELFVWKVFVKKTANKRGILQFMRRKLREKCRKIVNNLLTQGVEDFMLN
jgi:hypothetical protein